MNQARIILSILSGVIFSMGILLSGMSNPANVIAFLDVTSLEWNPNLAFVMLGAIASNFIFSNVLTKKLSSPILDKNFHVPSKKKLDYKIIAGSVLFGVGWGLVGYCPGPAWISLGASLSVFPVLLFCFAMALGALLYSRTQDFF